MANVIGEEILLTVTKTIGGTIGARLFVKESSTDVIVASSAGESVLGVSGVNALTSSSVEQNIPILGIVHVTSGAAVTQGALVTTDAAGKVIAFVAASHAFCAGRALTASSATGEVISVYLNPSSDNQ